MLYYDGIAIQFHFQEMIIIAEGKFSRPRSYRREEQEIDLAFEQLTGKPVTQQAAAPAPAPKKEKRENESPTIARNRMITAIALCSLAAVILIGVIIGIVVMAGSGTDNGLILNNVTVVGVNVGGLTPEQAAQAVHRVTDMTYAHEDMVIRLPDGELRLSPKDTGAAIDVDALVQAAYDYGRTGTDAENKLAYTQSLVSAHSISALPYLQLDRSYIRQALEDYFSAFATAYTESSYFLEGEKPVLDGEDFDENAPCQTLVLCTGTPGRFVDTEKIFNDILDAYSFNIFLVEADYSEGDQEPKKLDLDAIFEQLHSDPVNAKMDLDSFEVEPEIYGYTFDLEKAKSMLELIPYGKELRVQMEYIVPEVLSKDLSQLLYRDVLGSFESSYSGDEARISNLKLACKALNGLVIDPGEEFSFNETLGDRSGSDGYKKALCARDDEKEELGGGICQVASALYYCVTIGDLRVTERHAHSCQPDFGEAGMDAMVNGGSKDFQFLNTTSYPVRIEAEISGGNVKVRLLGTDEKDHFIRLESTVDSTTTPETVVEEYEEDNSKGYKDGDVIREGSDGRTVSVYKCRYSKDTGKLVSRDLWETSKYSPRSRVIAKVIPKPTEPSEETEPSEASEGDPTT